MTRYKLGNWALFILLSFIWGSSFILIKIAGDDLTGSQIGSTRIAAAGLLFLPLAIFHLKHIPLKKLHIVILSGAFGNLFPAFLFAIAIEKIDSSLAGILNSMTPLFVIVLGIFFFRMKVQGKKIAGVLIGFAGLVILSFSKGPININDFGFTLLIVLATILYGLNVNMVGYYLKDVDPFKIATVSMAAIGVPAAIVMWQQNVFSLIRFDSAAQTSIAIVILLGIMGTAIATALFYVLIQRAGALFASLVTYAIPVVAIFWGILDDEQVSLIQISCLGMILGGVYLANRGNGNRGNRGNNRTRNRE